MKIAFFGECIIELSGSPLQRSFTGDAINSAINFSRLVNQPHVSEPIELFYITALGGDAVSSQITQQWQQEKIDTQFVTIFKDKKPTLSLSDNNKENLNTAYYWRNNCTMNSYFQRGKTEFEENLHQFDYIYLTGISLAILSPSDRQHLLHLLTNYKIFGGKIIFDNNFDNQLISIEEAESIFKDILTITDIALLSQQVEYKVHKNSSVIQIIDRCRLFNVNEVVIKRANHSTLICNYDSLTEVATEQIKQVCNRKGVGDSFSAAYLAVRLVGGSSKSAAKFANQLAAQTLQSPAALIEHTKMPIMPEIKQRHNRYTEYC